MPATIEQSRRTWALRAGIAAGFLLLAWLQLSAFVHDRPQSGEWFLFGTDTVSHDAIVQMWIWDQVREGGGRIPLWMPPLKGGLPTLGAFLWTPFAPALWLHAVLDFPLAQRLQFVLALWWGALGAYWLARVLGMRRSVALFAGVGFGLCGHVVTLIHAGHLQKVLALAWMGWFAGGMVKALSPESDRREGLAGVAAAALALGAAFLSGHPQIAYIMVMLAGGRLVFNIAAGDWRGGRWRPIAARGFLILALGGCAGAAQLLPGLEMSRLSNRASGVEFLEAVETSYPPLETLELVLPRFLGDNSRAGHNAYYGQWGERIVSDYAGAGLVLLALLGALSGRKKEWIFWACVAVISLLAGFGDSVPLYRGLYEFWPGMKSFRSPGTFMAALALALPVMAGMGTEYFVRRRGGHAFWVGLAAFAGIALLVSILAVPRAELGEAKLFTVEAIRRSAFVLFLFGGALLAARAVSGKARRIPAGWVRAGTASAFALLLAVDLMAANSAFLMAVDWRDYSAYLAPDALDEYAVELPEPRRVLELGREQSLRPLLNGRDAMLGYHPISYGAFEEQLNALGAGTPEWRTQWGIPAVWSPEPFPDAPGSWPVRALSQVPGGVILADPQTPPPVRFLESRDGAWKWLVREPNRETIEARMPAPGTLIVAETIAPGWRWRVDEDGWNESGDVALMRSVPLSAGTHRIVWEYRPFSYRLGVFLTGLAFAFLAACVIGKRT